ncbi:MAG: peptidoglycan DD-metalloendopeptidase family protein [Enhydrobacter sp.]|nr:MAG: peptidoglycan DD-metalloendopeptidase family protein [Enhydrobacter sp.]
MLDQPHGRFGSRSPGSPVGRPYQRTAALVWPDVGRRPTFVVIEQPRRLRHGSLKALLVVLVLLLPAGAAAWLFVEVERWRALPAPRIAWGPAVSPLPAAGIEAPAAEPFRAENFWPAPTVGPAEFRAPGAPPEPVQDEPQSTDSYETVVRLGKGDTVAGLLGDLDFAREEIARAVATLADHVEMRRLPVGLSMAVQVRAPGEGEEAKPILQALTIRPEARREITLERDDKGDFAAREKVFETEARVERVSGSIDGSLIGSAAQAGVPARAMAEMLRAFSWDVNFQHDIKVGDRFDVMLEQSWTSDGKPVDSGRVLWASLTTEGGRKTHTVYRFQPRGGEDFFYDGEGRSVVKSLLRTPLNMSRISSTFGMRRHPLLGFTRMHTGVDFAAPTGTPILAAGSGTVAQAGRNGGYGLWVLIRHENGLSTGYAHMHGIARGVRVGTRVRQGQVIGFVGSTGMSTGPHLHFELHRNGRPVNPLDVARTEIRTRLTGDELARFKVAVAGIDRQRTQASSAGQ